MSEYELLSLLREHVSFMMSTVQWWLGITVGLLIGVQFLGRSLNYYIGGLFIALYTGFTFMVMGMELRHINRMDSIMLELEKRQAGGGDMSEITLRMLGEGGPPEWVIMVGTLCFWGLFLSTIGYIGYLCKTARSG